MSGRGPQAVGMWRTRDWSHKSPLAGETQLMSVCLSGGHDCGWWPGPQGDPQRGMLWLRRGPVGPDRWTSLQEMQSRWAAPSVISQPAFPQLVSAYCRKSSLASCFHKHLCITDSLLLPSPLAQFLAAPSGVGSYMCRDFTPGQVFAWITQHWKNVYE